MKKSVTTKKELGQHWLHDEEALESIIGAANISENDMILEVGPGLGTLTKKLVETKATVVAVEYDRDLIQHLKRTFKNCNNVAIKYGDIRRFDYSELPRGFKMVANIPYYLTSHLIRGISETTNSPTLAVLLVQKEVAERICAQVGSMSILSVTAQFYFECTLDNVVPAKLFTPPPKVDSEVVVLQRRKSKLFDIDEQSFFNLVKAGFSEKRKTLRNALSGGLGIENDKVAILLAKSGISNGTRAEELSINQRHALY